MISMWGTLISMLSIMNESTVPGTRRCLALHLNTL